MGGRHIHQVEVIDSHTGGEPTRVVMRGGPLLSASTMAGRVDELRERHDAFRRSVVDEPRGADLLVAALLCPPVAPHCAAGVIFFNNVGYLGMCGHGTIGLAVTLAFDGRLKPGNHRIDTPAGIVTVTLHDANRVSVENVASYRFRSDLQLEVDGIGTVRGDVAWGGNWFFLVSAHSQRIERDNIGALTDYTKRIRAALDASDIRGENGTRIDHIELFGEPGDTARADSRNFVLCPGMSWDRSPCGTGTSAKLACLVAAGTLKPGQTWRQESITGSIFEASARMAGHRVIPTITGTAYITARSSLLYDSADPLVALEPHG